MPNALTEAFVHSVCLPGTAKTCKFLALVANGFFCAKGTNIENMLRMNTTMRAQGDNCSGPPNYETEAV